jgi:hypothetical protein
MTVLTLLEKCCIIEIKSAVQNPLKKTGRNESYLNKNYNGNFKTQRA